MPSPACRSSTELLKLAASRGSMSVVGASLPACGPGCSPTTRSSRWSVMRRSRAGWCTRATATSPTCGSTPNELTVSGQVMGSDRRRYLVLVELVDLGGRTGHRGDLHLSRGARLQARRRGDVHGPRQARRRGPTSRPEWEQLVARLVREAPSPATVPVEVGLELAVEVGRSYGGFQPSPRLLMRPVRRGQPWPLDLFGDLLDRSGLPLATGCRRTCRTCCCSSGPPPAPRPGMRVRGRPG